MNKICNNAYCAILCILRNICINNAWKPRGCVLGVDGCFWDNNNKNNYDNNDTNDDDDENNNDNEDDDDENNDKNDDD